MSRRKKEEKKAQAVALQYNHLEDLPRIVASGSGEVARRIIEIAQENDVPVQRDEVLSAILGQLNVGSYIPPETFRLVAEVISFLFHADKEWREKHPELESVLGSTRAIEHKIPGE
jgi:flagellar biosynthesis protein